MEKEVVFDLVRGLKPRDHAVLFYEYVEDKYRVVFDFLKAGLDVHEATAYVAGADETPSQVRSLLEKRRIDVDACEKEGMLQIMSYKDSHLIDGEFNAKRTIALWAKLLSDALAEGFKGLRVAGDATWFLKSDMKTEFLDYEKSLHRVLDVPFIAMCAYSLPVLMELNQVQFVVDLIKAHSNVIFLGSHAGLVKADEIGVR